MYLYNLTLQRATGITHAVHGNFSGAKLQEIVVSRGKTLELMRPDPNTGKVILVMPARDVRLMTAIYAVPVYSWVRTSTGSYVADD